jgi:hypothetical protein
MSGLTGVLIGPSVLFVLSCVLSFSLVVLKRERLIGLLCTRPRRIVWELFPLPALVALAGIFIKAVDIKTIWQTHVVTDADVQLLYLLSVTAALILALQLFNFLHTDHAELRFQKVEQQRDLARRERDFSSMIPKLFLQVVSEKRLRLGQVQRKENLLEALDPKGQVTALLLVAHKCFVDIINGADGKHTVRVALFRVKPDRSALYPYRSFDGLSGSCTSPPDKLEGFLQFAGPEMSLAVHASRNRRRILVPDAKEADADVRHPFNYFRINPTEKDTVKSIAALPIWLDGSPDGPTPVLVVNTSSQGFFTESAPLDEQLDTVMTNLAHRLQLEFQLVDLLDS